MSNYLDNTCKNVKYYYTFKECVCDMWNDFTLHPDEGATVKGWYQSLRQLRKDIDQHGNPPWIDNMSIPVKELCLNYIKPIMYNKNVYFYTSDKEYTVTNITDWKNGLGTEQDMIQRVITFIQKIYTTKDKYEKLIELQRENIASIISDIENTTTATSSGTNSNTTNSLSTLKKNDTPQAFGNFTADNYVSEINSNKSEDTSNGTNSNTTTVVNKVALGNLAEKLAIAEQALVDYYEKWAKEVCTPFIIYY